MTIIVCNHDEVHHSTAETKSVAYFSIPEYHNSQAGLLIMVIIQQELALCEA